MSVRMLSARKDEEGEDAGAGGSVDFRCGVAVSPVVDWKFYGELNFIVYVMFPPPQKCTSIFQRVPIPSATLVFRPRTRTPTSRAACWRGRGE